MQPSLKPYNHNNLSNHNKFKNNNKNNNDNQNDCLTDIKRPTSKPVLTAILKLEQALSSLVKP
jgi:hypothetical protein